MILYNNIMVYIYILYMLSQYRQTKIVEMKQVIM